MIFHDNAFAVLAGNAPSEIRNKVERHFRHTILLPPDESIASPVSHHPDMIFSVIGDVLVTHEMYYHEAGKEAVDEICTLGGFRLMLSKGERGADYPRDVGFNALVYGNALIGRLDALAEAVLSAAERSGMVLVNVKQGYAACSTLYIPSAKLVCTADKGIAEVCKRLGANIVRLPSDTGILLPGYDCGFIGGCAGVYGDTVFFFGNPKRHPALAPLCEALTKQGIGIVSLCGGALTDYGGLRVFPMGNCYSLPYHK